MGKKRLATEAKLSAVDKKYKEVSQKKIKGLKSPLIHIYIQATYNNTLITITNSDNSKVITRLSAGALGFSGPKRSTPYAATQVAKALIERISDLGVEEVKIFVKGIGAGREAAIRTFANEGLNITYIKDITPIPHNGPRRPRPRKV
jgi:small subunit ribosomal protein S11